MFEADGTLVEGGGARAHAALLSGNIPLIRGRRVVVTHCGANLDARTFSDALQLGLTKRKQKHAVAC
jgi:threonine dehydratase